MRYINEIQFEEFEKDNAQITVSTMHKVKGKEYDSVYISVNNKFDLVDKYEKRLLYVALSRAKKNLHIHSQLPMQWGLNWLTSVERYSKVDEPLNKVIFSMSLKDVYLDFDDNLKNNQVYMPKAGDDVMLRKRDKSYDIFWENKRISRLALGDINRKIKKYISNGYLLNETASIEYLVNWVNKKTNKEVIVPLCLVSLNKKVAHTQF